MGAEKKEGISDHSPPEKNFLPLARGKEELAQKGRGGKITQTPIKRDVMRKKGKIRFFSPP